MPLGKGDHLYLIDGSAYIFRAYHVMPPLTRRSDGMPVGAVAGFCNMIHRMVEGFGAEGRTGGPTHLAVIFDYSSESFRNDLYDQYKANRPPPPEDLKPQFPLIRDATRAFGLPCIEMEGFEADDIIATYAVEARAAGAEVTIVSSDKDLAQLVGGGVVLFDPMKEITYGPEEIEARYGVGPDKMIDYQALVGDSVDNVPGAPGIGAKTASALLQEYGTLDDLLARAEEIKQKKRRETLIDYADQIRLSRTLVTLKQDVAVPEAAETFGLERPDPERLLGFLTQMEFRTLTARVAEAYGVDTPPAKEVEHPAAQDAAAEARAEGPGARRELPPLDPSTYETVADMAALEALIAEAEVTGILCFDLETTSLDEMVAQIVGIALSPRPGLAAYVPVAHVDGAADLLGGGERVAGQLDRDAVLEALTPILADPAIMKVGQNLKYDLKVLARYGITMAPIDDTMLMSYALDSGLGGHGMDDLAERHLDHKCKPIKDLIGSGKGQISFDRVAVAEAAHYAAEDADITLRLFHILRPRLAAERVSTVYHTLERPLVPVLAEMERHGIKVDRDILAAMSSRFAQRMARLEEEIHQLAGRP
ncbi:MAG: 5'-3' exonuclease H3TH domain-containing protein, partial [Pseudomonadota bacterium]